MIVKINGFELEISPNSDIYFGSKTTGQIFTKWAELDENMRIGLEAIQKQTETLVRQSELILRSAGNA
jgi:hypothetical protein